MAGAANNAGLFEHVKISTALPSTTDRLVMSTKPHAVNTGSLVRPYPAGTSTPGETFRVEFPQISTSIGRREAPPAAVLKLYSVDSA